MKEGWVEFQRIYCKEGYIDRWFGDQTDNPNNSFKSNININSMVSFFRLNNTRWISAYDLGVTSMFISQVKKLCKEFTAKEIWKKCV